MALSFSAREAKELLSRLDSIQKQQEALRRLPETYRADAERLTRGLLGSRAFEGLVLDEVQQGRDSTASLRGADTLIADVVRLHQLQPIADYSQRLSAQHQTQAQQLRQSLNACAGGFRRMFASSTQKQGAEQAYAALRQLLGGDYANHTAGMTADAQRIQQMTVAACCEQWAQNRGAFFKTAQTALKNLLGSGSVAAFDALLQQHEALLEPLRQTEAALGQGREEIKAACSRLTASGSLQILEGAPVEEVNRDKGGFRVKTLRDSGFSTLADIARATPAELAAVKGISPEGAQELKRITADYLRQSRDTVKIKLSTDDRSPEATALVCAIYQYIQLSDSIAAFTRLNQTCAQPVAQAKEALHETGNGALWLFTSAQEKQRVSGAYRYLNDLLTGEYGQTARQCTGTSAVAVTANQAWEHFAQNTVRYYNVLEEVAPGNLGNDSDVYGLPEDLAHAIQQEPFNGEGLRCELRRYQEWGVKYALNRRRVLLGDEMGLGKTVQAIAVMVSLRNSGCSKFAVICPASVLSNWSREIEKHSDLPFFVVHGSGRDKAFADWKESGGVAVTTYETTAHLAQDDASSVDGAQEAAVNYDLIVVDEAHYIKNAGARRSVNVKKLCEKAQRLLFMTGTAIENRVDEMISLMEVLQPDIAAKVRSMAFMSSAPQFREAVAPVYYRRKREDVLTELPDKVESPEWCKLGKEEKKLYESAVLGQKYADARRVSWTVDDLSLSSKANRLNELLTEAQEEGRKVIVFSFFLDTIRKISAMLGERCVGPINGSIPPQRRQEMIDAFEQAPAGAVLTAQIQSGGTGLNIQCASVVILCEPQFKPSIENQAISRAYRMGQSRNVLVYRLLCENTVDEKIMDMLKEKQAVFDAFADKSTIAEETMELDEKTFGEIMREEAERIKSEQDEPKNG